MRKSPAQTYQDIFKDKVGFDYLRNKLKLKNLQEENRLFENFPKVKKARCCFIRQKKHSFGISKPIFSYKTKSPESITNSFLQSVQVLVI